MSLDSNRTESLYRAFRREIAGFLRARVRNETTREDIIQGAFLKAHAALSKGEVPERPRAWLYQIVRNLMTDVARLEQRDRALRDGLSREDSANSTDVKLRDSEESNAVFRAVARSLPLFINDLDEPYRQALVLTELEGLSQAEAAERASVSLSCMKARVHRARQKVKRSLMACCTFELDARGQILACSPRGQRPSDHCAAPACGCDLSDA